MPTLEATLILKLDGLDLAGTPIVARLFVDDVQTLDQNKPDGGGFVALGSLPTVQALLVRTLDEPVTVRLDGQSDAGIVIGPAGFIFVFGGTIDAGATTNLKVQNASGFATPIQVMTGGTGT